MVSQDKIVKGITRYLDTEILPHLPTVKAIAAGTVVSLYLRQLPVLLDKIPVSMGIKNEYGQIDLDAIREALKARMVSEVPIDIPMIGRITVDQSEIDKLYRYIMEVM